MPGPFCLPPWCTSARPKLLPSARGKEKQAKGHTHTHTESGRWLEPAARRRQAAVITCTAALPATPTSQRAPPLSGAGTIPPHPRPICRGICGYDDDDDNRGDSCSKSGKKKNGKEKWGASVFLDVFTHRMQHWESEKASTKGKLRSEHSCISVVWEGGSSSSGGLPGRAPPPGAICKSGVRRCLVDRLPQEVPHYWRTM